MQRSLFSSVLAAFLLALLCTGSLARTSQGGALNGLPMDLDALVEGAAAKVGIQPPKVLVGSLPSGADAKTEWTSFLGVDLRKSVTIDINKMALDYETGEGLANAVMWTLMHEFMHSAGIGRDSDGDSVSHESPPTEDDCMHFRMQIEIIFYLCDALTFWQGQTDPHSEKVKKDLCDEIQSNLDYYGGYLSQFEHCGIATDVDSDGDGVVDDVEYIFPEYELLNYTLQAVNFSSPLSACAGECP